MLLHCLAPEPSTWDRQAITRTLLCISSAYAFVDVITLLSVMRYVSTTETASFWGRLLCLALQKVCMTNLRACRRGCFISCGVNRLLFLWLWPMHLSVMPLLECKQLCDLNSLSGLQFGMEEVFPFRISDIEPW